MRLKFARSHSPLQLLGPIPKWYSNDLKINIKIQTETTNNINFNSNIPFYSAGCDIKLRNYIKTMVQQDCSHTTAIPIQKLCQNSHWTDIRTVFESRCFIS